MYKFDRNHQFKLSDFNQPIGLKMNPENRWVKRLLRFRLYAASKAFDKMSACERKVITTALGYENVDGRNRQISKGELT